MGRDQTGRRNRGDHSEFQSTRPLWGATGLFLRRHCLDHISIHAPLVGRDYRRPCKRRRRTISIHAPLVGRDLRYADDDGVLGYISIHAPLVGRDHIDAAYQPLDEISIHAPLVGRDCPGRPTFPHGRNFNPRAPCGARPWRATATVRSRKDFNPRAPCGARRAGNGRRSKREIISIHAPLVGRDLAARKAAATRRKFQSTRPLWGATAVAAKLFGLSVFQSTRPLWGATGLEQERE